MDRRRLRVAPSRVAAVAALALSACAAYADAGDIDSPSEGVMCEDVSGYTIPCADRPPDVEPVDALPADPSVPPAEAGHDADDEAPTISAHDVLPLPHWLDPDPVPTGEGCPLPTDDRRGEIVGELPDRGSTRRERARARRAYRREQRRAGHRGRALKGKLVPY